MSEPIFREKSLQKVKSPDNLNEYIRVANPGVWMILVTIIMLLLGFCIWAVFGTVKTEVRADVHSEDGTVVCYISEADISKVHVGMTVKIGVYSGTITEITVRDGKASECTVAPKELIPDGLYTASITVEAVHPSFFLTN